MTELWSEFTDTELKATVDYITVRRIAAQVNGLIDEETDRRGSRLSRSAERQLAMARTMDVITREGAERAAQGLLMWSEIEETALRDAVLNTMFGLGRLQELLDDPDVEDVYIAGTESVFVRLSDGTIVPRPSVAESDEELLDQLRKIATHGTSSERQMVSRRPIIDMRLPDGQRAAVMWDVTPVPHVTIRVHRHVDVTLDRLVALGMLSPAMARFLEAAVRAGRSVVVIGPQGAGKTTLLRALAQCIPQWERFATLETEFELFLHTLRNPDGTKRFPLLIPMEARPGTGEVGPDGRPAGEMSVADLFPASLRHSLLRLLIGEMRADEIVPTLMAMARGYRGSMSSFHANSAAKTFNSLRSAVTFYSHNVSADAAMMLVADALDLIVCLDREQTSAGTIRYVSEILEVGDSIAENGLPASTPIFAPFPDEDRAAVDPRGYPRHKPEDQTWGRRVGFSMDWLDRTKNPAAGNWMEPFPERTLA